MAHNRHFITPVKLIKQQVEHTHRVAKSLNLMQLKFIPSEISKFLFSRVSLRVEIVTLTLQTTSETRRLRRQSTLISRGTHTARVFRFRICVCVCLSRLLLLRVYMMDIRRRRSTSISYSEHLLLLFQFQSSLKQERKRGNWRHYF